MYGKLKPQIAGRKRLVLRLPPKPAFPSKYWKELKRYLPHLTFNITERLERVQGSFDMPTTQPHPSLSKRRAY